METASTWYNNSWEIRPLDLVFLCMYDKQSSGLYFINCTSVQRVAFCLKQNLFKQDPCNDLIDISDGRSEAMLSLTSSTFLHRHVWYINSALGTSNYMAWLHIFFHFITSSVVPLPFLTNIRLISLITSGCKLSCSPTSYAAFRKLSENYLSIGRLPTWLDHLILWSLTICVIIGGSHSGINSSSVLLIHWPPIFYPYTFFLVLFFCKFLTLFSQLSQQRRTCSVLPQEYSDNGFIAHVTEILITTYA